jgi:hypothetical protein
MSRNFVIARPPCLFILRRCLLPAVLALAGLSFSAPARATLIHAFDNVFVGNDPTEVFTFPLSLPAGQPVVFTFTGTVANQNLTLLGHSGVRFALFWSDAGGPQPPATQYPPDHASDIDLPVVDPILGPQPVPVQFSMFPTEVPASVSLAVEGTGPDDNFRLVGNLTVENIPEPGSFAIALMSIAGLTARRKR